MPEHTTNPIERQFRRWTFEVKGGTDAEWIKEYLDRRQITPQTHPKVIDLCSGDGSVPAILIQKGWSAENIVCVDLFESPEPIVAGLNWEIYNLCGLEYQIQFGKPIEPQILALKNTFDLVTLFQGHLGTETEKAVCDFFVKPEGFIFNPTLPSRFK